MITSRPDSSPPTRLFVIADSISLHYGPHLEKFLGPEWTYERKQGRTTPIDEGVGANGGDSSAVLDYLRRRRNEGGIAADWLLFNCGLHDLKRDPEGGVARVERRAYEENLQAILDVVRELKIRPVWVRTTPVLEAMHNAVPRRKEFNRFAVDVEAYNESADRLMRAAAVPIVDLHQFTTVLMPDATYDGVHFHDDVKRLQGAFLAGALQAIASAGECGFRPRSAR